MHPLATATPVASSVLHRHAGRWLLALAVTLALALGLHGPIAQWADYHAFADARRWLGIPNAANVLSNLPFLLIGMWAWRALADASPLQRRVWRAFAVALACTALGSALYHWAPANGALVFDRLPIACACALLVCALLGERLDPRWHDTRALGAAALLGAASVGWWWLGERAGAGDLRPYLFVQFLPMLLVPAALSMKLPRARGALADRDWWIVLGLYAAAKLAELGDAAVQHALGAVSGHTLKHLLAAAGALWLLRAAARAADQLR